MLRNRYFKQSNHNNIVAKIHNANKISNNVELEVNKSKVIFNRL